MFERTSYQSQLSRFAGAPVIKVLTGMRRVGKSTLLRLFRDQLLSQGIPLDRIIYIDMERFEFASIRNAVDLHGYVTSRRQTPDTTGAVTAPDTHYLFIDEVQEITEWERAVNSLLNEGGFDIYLTGSNANLLSSELATLLTGRYVEMPVYPLSFREFAVFHSALPDAMLFSEFLKQGGMPGIHHIRGDSETTRQYLSSLADSIILKDIVTGTPSGTSTCCDGSFDSSPTTRATSFQRKRSPTS